MSMMGDELGEFLLLSLWMPLEVVMQLPTLFGTLVPLVREGVDVEVTVHGELQMAI